MDTRVAIDLRLLLPHGAAAQEIIRRVQATGYVVLGFPGKGGERLIRVKAAVVFEEKI